MRALLQLEVTAEAPMRITGEGASTTLVDEIHVAIDRQPDVGRIRLFGTALYSRRYPAVGETHGLSVVVGAIQARLANAIEKIHVLDMVAIGSDDTQILIDQIERFDPNVVVISVPYGTYGMLRSCKDIIARLLDRGGMVLIGGALPTYLREKILEEVDERLIVVVGEGEESAAELAHRFVNGRTTAGIPNTIQYERRAGLTNAPRKLSDPWTVPLPYRDHMDQIITSGAQVFVESSRACSWAACSFCLRGLNDIEGRSREYRRLPLERMVTDIRTLHSLGVRSFTFADEDFLGGKLREVEQFVAAWRSSMPELLIEPMRFDVSATIRSVYDNRDGHDVASTKAQILSELKQMGLNKIFLGIESGSATQLRRYHKGHTADEAAHASKKIIGSGLALEIGFIMFDPLCSLAEIIENVDFLLGNDLAQYVSGPTSELRLQVESRYLAELLRVEQKLGARLVKDQFDPDTLTLEYEYLDTDVSELVKRIRDANERFHSFTYGVKGLTRFASGALLGEDASEAKTLLGDYRTNSLKAVRHAATHDVGGYTAAAESLTVQFARRFIDLLEGRPVDAHPMIRTTLESAHQLIGQLA